MGYKTEYRMWAMWPDGHDKPSEPPERMVKQLEDEVRKINIFDSEGNYDLGWWAKEAVWDEHEQDMALLSKRFPQFVFLLDGNGEKCDDIWGSYFHDGSVMRGARSILVLPFGARELKPVPVKENRYIYQEEGKWKKL